MDSTMKWPEAIDQTGVPSRWISTENWRLEFFGFDQAEAMWSDFEMPKHIPGWVPIAQDEDESLVCWDSKTGACYLVDIAELNKHQAQPLAPSVEALLAMGRFEDGRRA